MNTNARFRNPLVPPLVKGGRLMGRLRGWFVSFMVDAAVWSGRETMDRAELDDRVRKNSFETDTSKLGVRWTEFLRSRLRRTWLKLRSTR